MTDLGHAGEGVGRHNGRVVFVPGALPGEQVRVRVVSEHKGFSRALLLDIVQPAKERVAPPCPIAGECGGCQLQHLEYGAQLRWKRRRVEAALARIGKFSSPPVKDTVGMAYPWEYRNKAQVPVQGRPGQPRLGFFRAGTHHVVDVDRCLIQTAPNNRVLRAVRETLKAVPVPPYDEETHQGVLRHVLARSSRATGEVMVVWVTRTPELPHAEALLDGLLRRAPEVVSVYQNVNPARTNVILGERNIHLWGKTAIEEQLAGLSFLISPRSFFQVNSEQAEVLYAEVVRAASLEGTENVLDAYCGTGTIALTLARRARSVVGIEVVPEAIADAQLNAERNGCRNARFIAGRVEDVLPEWSGDPFDVIVLDPPRRGCEKAVLEAVVRQRPRRVVYVSCHPETLARDVRVLHEEGLRLVEVQPVDMFPHTHHVEAVALLVS